MYINKKVECPQKLVSSFPFQQPQVQVSGLAFHTPLPSPAFLGQNPKGNPDPGTGCFSSAMEWVPVKLRLVNGLQLLMGSLWGPALAPYLMGAISAGLQQSLQQRTELTETPPLPDQRVSSCLAEAPLTNTYPCTCTRTGPLHTYTQTHTFFFPPFL